MSGVQPASALTDLLLAATALAFGLALPAGPRPRNTRLWRVGFFLAAAAAAGGTFFHAGLRPAALWELILLLLGATAGFFVAAAITQPYTAWLGAGLVITLAALGVQQSPLPAHNVVFHLAEIAALYCLFRGARRV